MTPNLLALKLIQLYEIYEIYMPSQPNDTTSTHCEPDSVGAYAALLDKNVASVLALLQEAGVKKIHASDRLSEQEKYQLLKHLQASLGIYKNPNVVLVGTGWEKEFSCLPCGNSFVIRRIGKVVPFESEHAHQEARMRATEMLKQLRKLIKKVLRLLALPADRGGSVSSRRKWGGASPPRASVYFHSLKVDGRNLP